jgi:peptidoglycan-associated lipoprotein
MQKKLWIVLALTLVLPGLLLTAACQQQVVQDTGPSGEAAPAEETKEPGAEGTPTGAAGGISEEELARNRFENEDIYYAFDSSVLSAVAQDVLRRKAEWLRNNPGEQVSIEGHCDERGTNEYNLALGERRAKSAHNFLVDLGIDASRLTTISYGEERPVDPGHNEEAWAKNRRAHFVLQ